MKKIVNSKNGISLITLVITIVVIIILAAAVVLTLGNNNPIEKAKEAKIMQDISNMQDELNMYISSRYVSTLGEFNINTFNVNKDTTPSIAEVIPSIKGTEYEDRIFIINGEIYQKATRGEQVKGMNANVAGSAFAYDNPVIPVGFKTMETTKATWEDNDGDGKPDGWDKGLVILDENNNEYVWIPVYSEVEYSKRNSNVNNNWSVTYNEVKDATLPKGVKNEQDQIKKYGGFYVARYEASLPDDQTTDSLMKTKFFSKDDNNRTDIGLAQSKKNKIVWNNISYPNSKIVAENVVSNNFVQSGLLTGTQWDTMCKFIEKDGVNVLSNCLEFGNYTKSKNYTLSNVYYRKGDDKDRTYNKETYTKNQDEYLLLPTGIFASVVENASPKNLCDVMGNVWEQTGEVVISIDNNQQYSKIGSIVLRGGCYKSPGTDCAAFRYGCYQSNNTSLGAGFRFVLFVK